MKKWTALCIVSLLSVLALSCERDSAYTTYLNSGGSFSVDLPKEYAYMDKRTEFLETAAGNQAIDFYLTYAGNKILMVGVMDHGMPELSEALTMESLQFARDMLVYNAEIITQSDYYLNGRPAVSVVYKKNENGQIIYCSGIITDIAGIQYQIQVASPDQEALQEPDALRFQLSFRYIGKS